MAERFSWLIALLLVIGLVGGSTPRLVGDGFEYLSQSLNFATLSGPSIPPRNFRSIQSEVAAVEPRLANWDIRDNSVAGSDRRRDFAHFWFYALIAAPLTWVVHAAGANPLFAFTLLNIALLGVAFRIALPRIGMAACLFLFGGPIVWWIDKAHTEVFTFSLLSVAVLLIRDRPWWSMLAAGAAATQNPPMAAVLGLVFLSQIVIDRSRFRDRRFWAGAGVGLALAMIHPAYYLARFGRPSLLIETPHIGLPSAATFAAIVVDPQIGLLGNFPAFLVAVLAAAVFVAIVQPRELAAGDVIVSLVSALVFVFAAAQTFNVRHGGTPSLSRYTLWLMPLAMPVFRRIHTAASPRWRLGMLAAAALSAAACCTAFHPAVIEYAYQPTRLASYVWTRHAGWFNPVPEIFAETILRVEGTEAPVATSGCEKILLLGTGRWTGAWPLPCYPVRLSHRCQERGALCYANRDGRSYDMAPVAGTLPESSFRSDQTWPVESEFRVQQLFDEWRWYELTLAERRPAVVRDATQIERVWSWVGPDRFLFVIARPGSDASLSLQLPQPMAGRLVDVASGETIQTIGKEGPATGECRLTFPSESRVLVLLLAAR